MGSGTRFLNGEQSLSLWAKANARPAGLIVKLAQAMDSRVTLTANEKTADCKRLFAVMKLAAKCGQELRVTVEGGDEDAACQALQDFCQAEL